MSVPYCRATAEGKLLIKLTILSSGSRVLEATLVFGSSFNLKKVPKLTSGAFCSTFPVFNATFWNVSTFLLTPSCLSATLKPVDMIFLYMSIGFLIRASSGTLLEALEIKPFTC